MFEKLYFEPGKLVGETTLGGKLGRPSDSNAFSENRICG